MNYTRPNDDGHEDSPEDWLSGALIFASALGALLKETEGVVVDIKGDMKLSTYPDAKKVIVYAENGILNIIPCEEDYAHGQLVWMHDNDEDIPKYDYNPN